MKFITIEGCDGVGKTSQASMLRAALSRRGYRVYRSFEPFGARVFDDCRCGLQRALHKRFPLRVESLVLFYLMGRIEHITHLKANESKFDVAIIDRWSDSTEAYQCHGLGFSIEQLHELEARLGAVLQPDLTLLLDADYAAVSPRRQRQFTDEEYNYEALGEDFYNRVRYGYQQIAEETPKRITMIDASKAYDEVRNEVIKTVDQRFPELRASVVKIDDFPPSSQAN